MKRHLKNQEIDRSDNRIKRLLFICLMMLTLFSTAFAQVKVSGKVVDTNNEPLIGVTIKETGTNNGVVSDINGQFSLNVKEGAKLEVSYIGYTSQTLSTANEKVFHIVLKESVIALDETVVVGYGTQKKASVTGSISSVDDKIFKDKGAVSNVMSTLQGAMPGVTVTRTTPAVGREGWGIKIRGEASVNSVDALVLIDGVPGSMDDINPNDIENISVLKDASAAIYGARAAGGVVLVTTKRGESGKVKISYKGSLEVKMPRLQVEWLNMSQYAYIFEEGVINDNSVAFFKGATDPYGNVLTGLNTGSVYKSTLTYGLIQEMKKGANSQYYNTVQPYNYGGKDIGFFDIDINDLLWGNATSQSHTLSINGGNDRNKFNFSVGYMNDESMLKVHDESSKRYNLRLNNDYNIAKWLDVSINLSFDRRNTEYATYNANSISGLPMGSPTETPTGNMYSWGSNVSGYGKAKLGGTTSSFNNRFSVSVQPVFHILKGLDLFTRASIVNVDARNTIETNQIIWYNYSDIPSNSGAVIDPANNQVEKTSTNRLRQEYQAYLEYKYLLNEKHSFKAMGGLSYENYRTDAFSAKGDKLSTGSIHSLNTASAVTAEDAISEYALASYFARLNYDYKGKYLLELLGRYDGSSRFARGHRWAPFFGASAAWRISEEKWMKSNSVFDNLKLRLSYGETGNQAGIGVYDYYAIISQVQNKGPLLGNSYTDYIKYGSVVSYNRTWEKVCNSNIGLDFAVLNNRLSGTLDLFQRVNNDMLVAVTYPQVYGATAPDTNSGKLKVKGWEIALQWRDKIGNVAYWIGGNLSDSKNKLVRMEGKQTKTWNGITSALEGYALNTVWGLEAIKLIETEEELNAYKATVGNVYAGAQTELKVGDVMYRDLDNDGKITTADVKLLGDTAPHYNYSFNFGLNWKGFDFNCLFQGVGKQLVFRSLNSSTALGYSWYQNSSKAFFDNHWTTVAEQCMAAGDLRSTLPVNRNPNAAPRIAYLAGKNYNYLASDAWWRSQNGAYLRMKNISLGYTFPAQLTKQLNIEKLRLYVAGNDLLTFCKIKDGYDPENTSYKNSTATSYTNYPFASSFIFGIDLTF